MGNVNQRDDGRSQADNGQQYDNGQGHTHHLPPQSPVEPPVIVHQPQGGCNQPQSPYDPAYQAQQQQRYAVPPGASKRNYDEEARNGYYPGNELSKDSRPPGVPPPPGKVTFTAKQEATHARMKGLDCRQAQRPYIPGSIPEGYPQNVPRNLSAPGQHQNQNQNQKMNDLINLNPEQQAQLLKLQQSNQLRKQQLIQQQKEQREELEEELKTYLRMEEDLKAAFMEEEKFRLQQQQLEMQNKYNQNAIQSYTPLPTPQGQGQGQPQYLTAPRTQQIAIQSPEFQTYPLQTPYVPPAAYVPNGAHPHFGVSAPRVVCGPPL